MKVWIIFMGILFFGIFISCQNSLDESDYNLSTTTSNLDIYALQIHLTSFPDKITQNISIYPTSSNNTIFSNIIRLSNNTQYTFYFTFNYDNQNQLVWTMDGDYLEFYNPTSKLQIIQKLRKPPVVFKSSIPGDYNIVIDTKNLSFKLLPVTNVVDLHQFDSLHFVSSIDNWQITPQNKMQQISGDDYYIIVTNLTPGQYLNFKFALGDDGLVYYSKDPQNPLSQNNKLLDAEVTTGTPLSPLNTFITSESCIIKFNIVAQSYSIVMNEQPVIGDGYYDSSFYGPAVLTNTNASAPIHKIYFRQTPNGFYFGIDGNFTIGSGLNEATGIQLALLLDETSKNNGFKDLLSLWSLPPITLHTTSSVEDILILEASNPKKALDGTDAIKEGIKFYSKLTNGMSESIIDNRKTLLTYNLLDTGYFRHGDIYEIFIPKMNGTQTNWDPGTLKIIGFSWNADTNWGISSNSNTTPINQALPNMSDSDNLPAPIFWADLN